ncbi:hypothetical protein G9U51_14980 [Calidifontibacter sp. DB0510]|uniref:Uncharacterized protein n=1 Tax=Metallococcus carri TaxID=1656884 RepID=A0A967B3X1_9MICO|nr:hypothetical protein [Metallococcus carri]NHN57073.1 hypothetical protein [Metallococcus carri]NOP39058.1 hypothetical protein [Calidifontibacter sp. DB2511S]
MKMRHLLIPLAVPAIAVGGALGAESYAKSSLTTDLRSELARVAPDAKVSSVDLRGRPYLVSRADNTVSTAYVDVTPTGRIAERTLLVQNLRLEGGRIERLTNLVTVPYADGARATPVLTAEGAYTDRGTVDGRTVTYAARWEGGRLTVSANRGPAPQPVTVQAPQGSRVVNVSATKTGVLVELAADNVSVPRS